MSVITVLSGDIVASSSYTAAQLNNVIAALKSHFTEWQQHCDLRWQVYRGDAFQAYVSEPGQGLALALSVRARLATLTPQCQATQSLAVGQAELLRESPGESQGPVFEQSGRQLESQENGSLQLALTHPELSTLSAWQLAVMLFDKLTGDLSQRQAEILLAWLQAPELSQQALADKLGTSRQNVHLHFKRMNMDAIVTTLNQFQEYPWR